MQLICALILNKLIIITIMTTVIYLIESIIHTPSMQRTKSGAGNQHREKKLEYNYAIMKYGAFSLELTSIY